MASKTFGDVAAAAQSFADSYAARCEVARASGAEFLGALALTRSEVLAAQRGRLRALLAFAATRSRFWRERLELASIDPATAEAEDLHRLPPLTKSDVMRHWDDLATVEGMTKEAAEAHLEGLRDEHPGAATAWRSPST